MGHPGSSARIKPQGIGARVLRKEDQRHLQGTGNFVADMVMPGLSEVAFMRSPLAHVIGHTKAVSCRMQLPHMRQPNSTPLPARSTAVAALSNKLSGGLTAKKGI